MKGRIKLAVAVGVVVAATATVTVAMAGRGGNQVREQLTGYEEVPALSTTGSGSFRARLLRGRQEISYRLRYRDLEAPITQAHIHFGQRAVNGGISVFLCTNVGGGPPGTQPCPPAPGTITGTIRPADVIGPAAQGIDPGELGELLRAARAGVTYVNVHTQKYPAGEIRAQLEQGKKGHLKGDRRRR